MTSTMNSFQIPSLKLFLSHDWGLQKENHLKVKAIADILRTKTQVEQVWIDDQEISGGNSLESKITEGILNANVFLMFITKNYERKYNSGDQNDACWFEVTMAIQEKRKILPIVLSHEMSSTSQWIPPFKTRFAHLLFLGFSEGCLFQNPTILLDQKCDEIISAALRLLLPSSLPNNTVTGSAVSVSVPSLIHENDFHLNLIKTKLIICLTLKGFVKNIYQEQENGYIIPSTIG